MTSKFGALDIDNLKRVAAISAAAVTALQTATAVAAVKKGRRDYADGAWGPGLATVALVGAAAGSGDVRRRWALAAVTTGWAIRLERQMLKRLTSKDEEDPRYTEFLDGDGTAQVVTKVFVTQALSQLVVSAPLQLAAASTLPRSGRRWLAPLGIVVAIAGAVTEALGDKQKSDYSQRDKDERPDVLDTGLWGWSRHPNYFGDSVVWDGVYLTAAASAPAAWAFPAPAAMSYFLMFATGAKRTEKRMEDRPGYREYQKRTAFFFPRPPRKD